MWEFVRSNRGIFALIATAGWALIAVALYMQYALGLEPCNLCLFQRVFVTAAASVATIAAIHGLLADYGTAWVSRIYAGLVIVLSATGAWIAGRQLWLQSLPPDQVPACGPDLDYMLDVYPFLDMVRTVLEGSGDCAKTQWIFLGLSIPGWTLTCFIGATVLSLCVLFRARGSSCGGVRGENNLPSFQKHTVIPDLIGDLPTWAPPSGDPRVREDDGVIKKNRRSEIRSRTGRPEDG